ncbi:hypothetical protein UFOVP10_37 [uncultured Caudovirales phage]|uniref:Uncharacterized protein n=1 Tax=uncultured Caudovirales phage TaxID=2100421 RepID=A0A6J5KLQ0_9CAUD|nr:hypothetical protein UFOVP10_37 [uncultured Caudovirales phage]
MTIGQYMKAPPKHIIGYIKNPSTWDAKAFETAIRNDVENSTGTITAADELLIGSLSMVMDTMITAQANIMEQGLTYQYHAGEAASAWYKIRTESLDKAIKILAELALVARGRPKKSNKVSDVDELFATA